MNAAVLGANWPLCAEAIDQTVVPAIGLPSPSVQVKAAPPHSWTSIPRCRLYHAWSAGASLALKKMPPMPVTRFIEPRGRVVVRVYLYGVTRKLPLRARINPRRAERGYQGLLVSCNDSLNSIRLRRIAGRLHREIVLPCD